MEITAENAPQKVTYKGQTEACILIGDTYFYFHPIKEIAMMRGKFCTKEEAEKIEPATYLNILR